MSWPRVLRVEDWCVTIGCQGLGYRWSRVDMPILDKRSIKTLAIVNSQCDVSALGSWVKVVKS